MKNLAYEYLKSGLSINTHIGCSNSCKYCVLSNLTNFPQKPTFIEHPTNLVEKITNGHLYLGENTPIYINNRTDPFLHEVSNSTIEVLNLIRKFKIKSPIILITKMSPDKRLKNFFNDLNLLFFYTYTNLKGIDYNSSDSINERNMENIHNYVDKDSRYHYYRPVIPNRNDSIDSFEESLIKVGVNFKSTIIGGIRLVKNNYGLVNIDKFDRQHKLLDSTFYKNAVTTANKYNHNIIRHTSCAIAIHMNIPNKLDYFNKETHCNKYCINYKICENTKCYKESEIKNIITNITKSKFTLHGNGVYFHEKVSQEIVALLKSSLGLEVFADDVILSFSERYFSE